MSTTLTLLCLAVLCAAATSAGAATWRVQVTRTATEPLVSEALGSGYDFTYNAAMFEQEGVMQALVRCQNLKNASVPWAVGPSVMSPVVVDPSGKSATQALRTVFEPTEPWEKCGTEDPRIAEWKGKYYMFYTAYDCKKAALALAVSDSPANASSWQRKGILFPKRAWSKSGAAVLGRDGLQYLLWGDSTIDKGLHVATSPDGLSWTTQPGLILAPRPAPAFDSQLVEAGPPPLPLASGHLMFLYNSARAGYPSPKPGYDLQYNVGFAILNASNPGDVMQRSDQPVLSPVLPWETGNNTAFLTPHVVFVEGMLATSVPLTDAACAPGETQDGRFLAIYGAADAAVGAAEVLVCMTL